MNSEELAELTDEELLTESKKIIPNPVLDAFLIGFSIGIVIYGVVSNGFGFFLLIPLFFVYQLLKKSKKYDAIEKLLKERNLK